MLFLFSFSDDSEDRLLLSRLFEEYSPMMLRSAASTGICLADAEDVVGDTFEYLWRNAMPKLHLMEEEKRKATLLIAAKNRAKNLVSKQSRLVSIEACDIYNNSSVYLIEDETQNSISNIETYDALKRAIDQLPPELSETLYLHLVAGFTRIETAKLINANISTVYKRIKRGKQLLRDILRNGGFWNE